MRLGCVRRPDPLPDPPPIILIREREFDRKMYALDEHVIHVFAKIGSQDHHALMLFHLLQQVN
jgi:hypothetical protein